jgi:hypothetical protein
LWSTSAPSIAILSWSPSSFGVMAVPTGGVSLLCSRRRKLIPGWWPLLNLAPDPLLRWSNLRPSLVPTRFPWPLAVLLTVLLRLRRGAMLRLRRDALSLIVFSFLLLLIVFSFLLPLANPLLCVPEDRAYSCRVS